MFYLWKVFDLKIDCGKDILCYIYLDSVGAEISSLQKAMVPFDIRKIITITIVSKNDATTCKKKAKYNLSVTVPSFASMNKTLSNPTGMI